MNPWLVLVLAVSLWLALVAVLGAHRIEHHDDD